MGCQSTNTNINTISIDSKDNSNIKKECNFNYDEKNIYQIDYFNESYIYKKPDIKSKKFKDNSMYNPSYFIFKNEIIKVKRDKKIYNSIENDFVNKKGKKIKIELKDSLDYDFFKKIEFSNCEEYYLNLNNFRINKLNKKDSFYPRFSNEEVKSIYEDYAILDTFIKEDDIRNKNKIKNNSLVCKFTWDIEDYKKIKRENEKLAEEKLYNLLKYDKCTIVKKGIEYVTLEEINESYSYGHICKIYFKDNNKTFTGWAYKNDIKSHKFEKCKD